MKALSIYPPYAMEIAYGEKTKEYRTWPTNYRGDLLICSTKAHGGKGTIPAHAVCVAEVTDCKKLTDGTFAWFLDDVRAIKPVPIRGQQGIYDAPVEIDDLELLPADLEDDEYFAWLEENFYPYIKGAYVNSKGEWRIPLPEFV